MSSPMTITEEMMNSREKRVDEIVETVNRGIRRAVEQGSHSCYFACSKDSYSEIPFYEEVRSRFERAGYRIEPTGYIGGVWQRTEHIVW